MERYYITFSSHSDYDYRQFPEVDPVVFRQSAKQFNRLIRDANKILTEISTSEPFAKEIMDAAQRSDFDKVKNLILQLGIESNLEVKFSPESLRLILRINEATENCCILNLGIRWSR